MPGPSQDTNSKPVVVIRRKPVAKATVTPPVAKPAMVKPTKSVAAKSVAAKPVTATPPTAKPVTAKPVLPPVADPPAAPPNTPAPKPPTSLEDPAVIAARRAARYEATCAVLQEIMARWPRTFPAHPEPVRPLARGIGHVIAAQFSTVPKMIVHQAIGFWQRLRKTPYLQAMIAGGPRYDLDGNPNGEVTPEEQERARIELIAWRASRQEKRRQSPRRLRPAAARDRRDNGNSQPFPPTQSDAVPEVESQEPVSEGVHES